MTSPATAGQRAVANMTYLDYEGSVERDDQLWHGRVLQITDIVTYSSDTIDGLALAFVDAVDDYLETCHQLGDPPCQSTTPRVAP